MNRNICILLTIVFVSLSLKAKTLDSKLLELDHVMERRDTYYMQHEHKIDSLKNIASSMHVGDIHDRFRIYHEIFNTYRSYQNDSARVYVDKELELANKACDSEMAAIAKYDDVFTYISKGDFTNAVNSLNEADLSEVSDSIKAEMYVLAARLYSDLSNFTSSRYEDNYALKSKEYGYAASLIAKPNSYVAHLADFYVDGNWKNSEETISLFQELIESKSVSPAIKAMLYSMIGDLYIASNNTEEGLIFKAQSAVMDIQSATRETTSKHFLAYKLLGMGDVERAARYIHIALEDAENYNAPQRKAEIGQALSLIELSRYSSMKNERNMLWIILSVSLVFVLVIGLLFIYIRSRNHKLRLSQSVIERQNEEISAQNTEITQANDKLTALNAQLRESIKIKDEYIGYVFYLISEYIKKIETVYKLVNLKLTVNQPNDLKKLLPVSDIRLEKEKMLKEFDRIFLSLFPTFIEQYQKLFNDEESQLLASADGILTPEMRIFALIRLGVTDTANIAQFLNYSTNTINTYKTKAKKRSIVSNEEFESRIMQIKSVK